MLIYIKLFICSNPLWHWNISNKILAIKGFFSLLMQIRYLLDTLTQGI